MKDKGKRDTTNFDDLGDVNVEETGKGFDQIPGLASQRLMRQFRIWVQKATGRVPLYRTTWFMTQGLPGGSSFLEDYIELRW